MKQQQILGITLVLIVQQAYFFTAVNSNAVEPVPSAAGTKIDPPAPNTTTTAPITTSSTTTPATTTPATTTPATTPPTPPPTTKPTTTTTPEPTTPPPTTTPAPPITTKAPQPPQPSRHFDLPSFIGGIVLTLGLIGIGFVGHKIYKSKFDRNYHTL